jgi:preprotein translocase subunit SecG
MTSAVLFAAVPTWVPAVMNVILFIVSAIILIPLILIQRGKGGGLAGAFGGAGGSSAFGSRAGDTFTRITIYVAAVWILLIMFLIKMVQPPVEPPKKQEVRETSHVQPADPGRTAGEGGRVQDEG